MKPTPPLDIARHPRVQRGDGRGLASGVVGLACFCAELAGHPLLGSQGLRDRAARRRLDDLVVTEPTRSDQELGAVLVGELHCIVEVRLRAVADVGQSLLRGPAQCCDGPAPSLG